MAKKQPLLGRLVGMRVLFQGRFGRRGDARLKAQASAHGAVVAKALDAQVDYLVLPDAASAKAVRQKAQSLIAKGATIRVLEAGDFEKLVEPTGEELLALILAGGKKNGELFSVLRGYQNCLAGTKDRPQHIFEDRSFDGLDLSDFDFDGIAFERCRFVGATLKGTTFDLARHCDFSKAAGANPNFKDITGSKLTGAKFDGATFQGVFDDVDFSGACIAKCSFYDWAMPARPGRNQKATVTSVIFRKALLPKVTFEDMALTDADFSGADLTGCKFEEVDLKAADFRGATLKDGLLYACKMPGADFTNADLRGANLADTDLSGCKLSGADLTGCNLRGAKLDGADLKKVKGYDAGAAPAGGVGPSLKELDAVGKKVRRLSVLFRIGDAGGKGGKDGEDDGQLGVTGTSKWGYFPRVPYSMDIGLWRHGGSGKQSFSAAMVRLANALGHRPVRFETVQVSTSKSPRPNGEVRGLAVAAVAEAFGQAPPDADALAAATKAHREKEGKKAAAGKKKNAAARAVREKRESAARAKALAEIAKEAGQVSDFDSFMKAIVVRTDKEKVTKATKMLKASGFQLFNDVADTHLLGVVKSQSDPDLVYACRVDHEGHYACCTQNLNVCGGLRGSICKHLLVLIIGLVKAGQLDPATIDGWVAKTHGTKPGLDKETMGEIFIRYKGAEAGEVDWRPTETVPEDYYAL